MPLEPRNSRVLGHSHGIALVLDAFAPANESAVLDARVVDVLEGEVELEQGLEGVALEVVGESVVDLGCEELDGHGQVRDVLPDEPRRVPERHDIHETRLPLSRTQVADGPAAVAEADGA